MGTAYYAGKPYLSANGNLQYFRDMLMSAGRVWFSRKKSYAIGRLFTESLYFRDNPRIPGIVMYRSPGEHAAAPGL